MSIHERPGRVVIAGLSAGVFLTITEIAATIAFLYWIGLLRI